MSIPERAREFFASFCMPRYIKGNTEYGGRLDTFPLQLAIDEVAEEIADALLYVMRARELARAIPDVRPRPEGIRVFIGTTEERPHRVVGFIIIDDEDPVLHHGTWRYHGEASQGQFLAFYAGQDNLPQPGTGFFLD